jgi:hypothetical protein
MLVTGNEGGNTLLMGARASLVKEVKLLEFHRIMDGEYKVGKKQIKRGKGHGVLAVVAGAGGLERTDGKPCIPHLLDLPHALPHGERVRWPAVPMTTFGKRWWPSPINMKWTSSLATST